MAQMTKDFAESLMKRVQAGQHINTTVWEEEQLIRGWLYWHEHDYQPRMKRLVEMQNVAPGGGIGVAGGEALAGSMSGALGRKV